MNNQLDVEIKRSKVKVTTRLFLGILRVMCSNIKVTDNLSVVDDRLVLHERMVPQCIVHPSSTPDNRQLGQQTYHRS